MAPLTPREFYANMQLMSSWDLSHSRAIRFPCGSAGTMPVRDSVRAGVRSQPGGRMSWKHLPRLLAGFALGLACLVGCRDSDETTIKIGIAFDTLQTEYWVASFEAFRAELDRRGIEMIEAVADHDANRQLDQIHTFIARGVDGIIVAPIDAAKVSAALDHASKERIMIHVALIGAAGKMGTRISRSLEPEPDYHVMYVEGDAAGEQRIRERGDTITAFDEAVPAADIVVMAVPDRLVGAVAAKAVPQMRSRAMVVCLDPAGPYAGLIPEGNDVTVFVCHPAHPSVFNEETDMEARFDFFGSGRAKQPIVCALMRGPEADYDKGVALATAMWKPVTRAHRVTIEQMAILEPALSETVAATCITIIREAMEEAVSRGVPREAARDFLLGHVFCELGIIFDESGFPFSDGALEAIEEAKKKIFRPDWKKVFEPDALRQSVARIVGQGRD